MKNHESLKARMGLAAVAAVLFGSLGILMLPSRAQANDNGVRTVPAQVAPGASQALSAVSTPKL